MDVICFLSCGEQNQELTDEIHVEDYNLTIIVTAEQRDSSTAQLRIENEPR